MSKERSNNVLPIHGEGLRDTLRRVSDARGPRFKPTNDPHPAADREEFGYRFAQRVAEESFYELECIYSPYTAAVWVYQWHRRALGYTPAVLAEIERLRQLLIEFGEHAGREMRHIVWGSRQTGIFNLGGDLTLIAELVSRRDRRGLNEYAARCVEACHGHAINFGLPLISIAMVQGDALGGGFESVLSADVIVAERESRFGLPEIVFGLFPAMGAHSFLTRRLGRRKAEEIILSGHLYTAEEMKHEGIVDVLAENGQGVQAVANQIAATERRYAAMRSIYRSRHRVDPVTHDEMMDIASLWVDAALEIEPHNIRRITRLAEAQRRRHETNERQMAATP